MHTVNVSLVKKLLQEHYGCAEMLGIVERAQGRSRVGMLSIPGLTHPVRDLYLEDVLERTNFVIGRGSK